MGHDHHHHHKDKPEEAGKVRMRLQVAFALNFFFTIIEFIGGAITNSMAILSDAVHDLGDTVAIGSALWLEKVAERGRDNRYTYGYRRFSTLGALLTSLILFAGSIIILSESIPRLLEPQEVMTKGMMWMALLGILFNGLAVLRLRGGNASLNNRAVMLHLMEDVLGWVAVLVGSIVIHYTGWFWIDPLLSIGVAIYILFHVFGNVRKILDVFLQTTPADLDVAGMETELVALDGVHEVHDIHSWSLDGNYNVLSIHIVVDSNASVPSQQSIRGKADEIIRTYGIDHPTVAIEFKGEACPNCKQIKG
jgi:cobalt-zinc-cadmium efflux system protein